MDTLLGRYKNLIVLAVILFAQILALAMQVRRPSQQGETRLIRLWAVSAVTPLEKAVVHTQKWVHDLWQNYSSCTTCAARTPTCTLRSPA